MAGTPAGGSARFSCPPNFLATGSEPPRFSLEALTGPDTELWLIQAPVDFIPSCLNGRLVPLSGSQLVKGKVAGKRHRYRILSSSGPQSGHATLLAPSAEAGGGLTCAPPPQGNLRIIEGPQEATSGIPLQPIPASPAPQIPEGLRPRFCAFGGSPPVTGPGAALALKSPTSGKRKKKRHQPEAAAPGEPVNGHGALEVDAALGTPEMAAGKKRKRKNHPLEVLKEAQLVDTEPLETELQGPPMVLSPASSKKRKRLREVETAELIVGMAEPDRTGEKPLLQDDMEEQDLPTPQKKKHQMGTEQAQLGEGVPSEWQLQQKMEPLEEAVLLPSPKKKKKKKEKGCLELMEPGTGVLESSGEIMELEGPPPAQETLPLTKKRKKDRESQVSGKPQEEMGEPELPDALGPETGLTPAKRKKERRHRVTEAGKPGGEVAQEEGVLPGREKKRKKQLQPDSRELVSGLS